MKLTPLLARPGLALLCLALATPLVRADPPVVANQLTLSASATAEISNDVLVITFSTQREGADPAALQAHLTQALNAALAEAQLELIDPVVYVHRQAKGHDAMLQGPAPTAVRDAA